MSSSCGMNRLLLSPWWRHVTSPWNVRSGFLACIQREMNLTHVTFTFTFVGFVYIQYVFWKLKHRALNSKQKKKCFCKFPMHMKLKNEYELIMLKYQLIVIAGTVQRIVNEPHHNKYSIHFRLKPIESFQFIVHLTVQHPLVFTLFFGDSQYFPANGKLLLYWASCSFRYNKIY